ncbi:serine hydrolase domain-containing protein [Nitratireductor rhodophyticola]|uniref:serine hydrolase domain-containing protein n=1 Tax=Nitratireductor rhodophyticola TaxID=2854036 RepID=UPI002AC95F56|nr:serine hydrolase domain-containing protein [Nitratireductor rhodophyticola]WPZ12813.1 serine hydrolase domain-containing protein [Nitratireductor rhodophyticola]
MQTASFNQAALDALRRSISARVDAGELAGATWLIHHAGETHVDSTGTFGMNGAGAPMARDTIYRVASITKPVTAALAMMLVEDGVLTLDGPVDDLLPELANRQVLKRIDGPLDETVPANGPVTLRHLLTMTFGLGAIMVFPEAYPIQAAMREAGVAPSWVLPQMSSDAYMKKLGELPLAANPGESFFYNNGLDVAGILIERATGERLGAVLKTRLLEPLGMKDTDFFVPDDKQHRLPVQYGPDFANGDIRAIPFGPEQGIDFSTPPQMDSGAGGLVTTVDDYAAFCRMMLNGGALDGRRYLKAETVTEMTRDQLTQEQKQAPHAAMFMDDGGAGWGLGMSVGLKSTRPWLAQGSFGWNGGYGTTAYTDPKNGLVGIFLSQQMMTSPDAPKTYLDFWKGARAAVG